MRRRRQTCRDLGEQQSTHKEKQTPKPYGRKELVCLRGRKVNGRGEFGTKRNTGGQENEDK